MKHDRRKAALARLQEQITSGVKTCKGKLGLNHNKVKLTDSDIKRINKEMEILEKHI